MTVGTHNYTVSLQGYPDAEGTVEITDGPKTVNVDMLGLSELSVENIEIYPNPNKGVFLIRVDGTFILDVLNAMGKVVHSTQIINESTINLKDAGSGLYFIRLHNEKTLGIKRLIISK